MANKPFIPKVTITKSTDNLGRTRVGQDHISGFIFDGIKPVEFDVVDDVLIYSVNDAEDVGITTDAFPVEHYHISEFYRMFDGGQLYVGFDGTASGTDSIDYTAITRQARFADGRIRLMGFYTQEDLSEGIVNALQGQKVLLDGEDKPLSIFLGANIVNLTDENIPSIIEGLNYGVAVITDQSGQGTGADLFGTQAASITAVGNLVGSLASIPVSTAVGYVQAVSTVAGDELDVIADGKGVLYSSKPPSEIEAQAAKGYVILMKHPGLSGTFYGIDYTAAGTGDLNRIRLNRTMDKAVRGVGIALRTKLNAPLILENGLLAPDTRAAFESLAGLPLQIMQANQEISEYKVFIDPNQDILGTDTLRVQISIVPVGAAEFIDVTIGYAKSV